MNNLSELSRYDKRFLGPVDKLKVKWLKRKWVKAMENGLYQEAEDYHYRAELIRISNGYRGGPDGDAFIKVRLSI